ncbi:MAG: hypothetical protein ACRC0E_04225 [Soonwooa sp.]
MLLVFSLLFMSLFKAQNNADQQGLKPIIEQIIDGFSSKNADKINAFVNKDLGIGVVFKSENQISYLNLQELDFSLNFPGQKTFWNITTPSTIKFERTPGYNAEKKTWSSYGTFCQIDSPIVLYFSDEFAERGNDLSDQTIFKVNDNTENTAYVVLAEKNAKGLQFILTKIDANWTLTFFDLLNIYNFIPNFSFSVSKHTNTNFPL